MAMLHSNAGLLFGSSESEMFIRVVWKKL